MVEKQWKEDPFLPIADAIESLITVEIRQPAGQGIVRPLAAMARRKQGAPPILLAARRLIDTVRRGDVVVISTGFVVPNYMPAGEDDGPPGAASLARAVSLGLGAVPLILTEQECLEPVRATLRAIGLAERPLEDARKVGSSYVLQSFPADESAEARADEVMRTYSPKAVIVIEKPGLNEKGVAHRGGGLAITASRARIEVLTGKARAAGVPTIAVGDAGNEAGMGLVADAVREYHRWGTACQCPCATGIADTEVADVTVIAQVSNWGGYGIATMLGILLGNAGTLHDADTERQMLEDCNRAGAVDGLRLNQGYSCDDIAGRVHTHIVDILQTILCTALGRPT